MRSIKNVLSRKTTLGMLLLLATAWMSIGSVSLADSPVQAVYLGQPSALMVQPYIVAEVFAETTPDSGDYSVSLGPSDDIAGGDALGDLFREIFGSGYTVSDELLLGTPNKSLLLDTGANSIILVDTSAASVEEAAANLAGDEKYQPAGEFRELGIAGYHFYNVSAPYRFGVTGSDGNTHFLENARIQTNPKGVLAAPIDMGGIAGLAGMPAMTGRVTSISMSTDGTEYPSGAIEEMGEWELIALLTGGMSMSTTFSNDLPETTLQRYTIPLDNRIRFPVEDGLPPDSAPGSPLPIYADVPFLTTQLSKTSPVDEIERSAECTFLLDTGAQFSIISRRTAFMLGLDENGDGDLWDDRFDKIQVAGISGKIDVPILCIDEIRVETEQGTDLVWNDPSDSIGVQVIVLDIIPSADVNYDGIVDATDIALISGNFNTPIADLEFPMCDVDGDKTVGQFDLDLANSLLGETVTFDGIFGIDMLTGGRSLVSSTPTDTTLDAQEIQTQIDDLQVQIDTLNVSDPFYDADKLALQYQMFPLQAQLIVLLSGTGSGDLVDAEFAGTSFFDAVHFDFRNWDSGTGALVVDVDSVYGVTVEEEPIPGDANGDGKVDGSDVTILAGNWQATVTDGAASGDFNGDGVVDGSDVTILAGNWQYGISQSNTAAVPEPATWILLISLGIFMLIGRGRVSAHSA